MATQAYFNLLLDTTSPSIPVLTLGTNGYINSLKGTLGIKWTEDDTLEMKVWGIMGTISSNFTGDGSTTVYTVAAKPENLTEVTVNGATTTDYTYSAETGEVTFTTAPEVDAPILIQWRDILTEGNASWEPVTATKDITLPEQEGSLTVFAKLRDDVYNESEVASVTVVLDLTPPVVSIIAGPTPNKISKISGKNVSQFTFQVSEDFIEYKVCVVANSDITAATAVAIGTANGSTNMANTGQFAKDNAITCTITGADLEAASMGDGTKLIKVFVRDSSNNWSL